MVDVADSKSAGGDTVWVRAPPPVPNKQRPRVGGVAYFLPFWARTRGLLAKRWERFATRGGLRRSAGRAPPPVPNKQRPRVGGVAYFLPFWARTRGLLVKRWERFATRGGLPRTAGQLPPYCPLCRDSLAWRLRAHKSGPLGLPAQLCMKQLYAVKDGYAC